MTAETALPGPITVLVCTRGRPQLLGPCIDSILGALGEEDELLVVEADHSGAILPASSRDPRLRHLVAARPGKSRQLNQGLLAAVNEVVVLTDDDCRVEPTWVSAMARQFGDPAVGVACGHVRGLSGVRGVATQLVPPGPAPAVTWDYASGAAMALRRSAVLAAGGFDERMGPGTSLPAGEDHDVILRLQEAGWTAHVADAPPVDHLEWRDRTETRHNLLAYSHGAGSCLGAALRRSPRRWARTVLRRVRYQALLWGHRAAEGRSFGPATSLAFGRGLLQGLLLRPRRFL